MSRWWCALALAFMAGCSSAPRATDPAAGKVVPPHEVRRLENGVTVYFFKGPAVPIFEVQVAFETGADMDPVGKTGLTVMTANMLRRGVEGFDESQISVQLDDLAADFEVGVGQERTIFSASGLNEQAGPVLDLFFRMLRKPTFPEGPYRRVQRNYLDRVSRLQDAPGSLGARALGLMLLRGTVKARPMAGFLGDLRSISPDDMKAWHDVVASTRGVSVLVTGGEDEGAILAKVLAHIGKWAPGAAQPPVPAPSKAMAKRFSVPRGQVVFIPRPGLKEAHVAMGFIGPARGTPDYYDLEVAEAALSGPFRSRLNQALREKTGLTYGVSADFNYSDALSVFSLSSVTSAAKAGKLVRGAWKVLGDFAVGRGIDDEEVGAAKQYLTGAFPLLLGDRYGLARMYFNTLLSGLPPTFLDDYIPRIERVTAASLRAAVARHFPRGAPLTVVVGDPSSAAKALREAGIPFIERGPREFL